MLVKICEKCGGIMNYDPYFKQMKCNSCLTLEKIKLPDYPSILEQIDDYYNRVKAEYDEWKLLTRDQWTQTTLLDGEMKALNNIKRIFEGKDILK